MNFIAKNPNQLKKSNKTEKLKITHKQAPLNESKSATKKPKSDDENNIKEQRRVFQPVKKPSEDHEIHLKRKEKGCSLDEIEKILDAAVEVNLSNEPSEELASKFKQLDKRQRMELFMKRLHQKPPATKLLEAYELINSTLIEIEDEYGPKIEDSLFFHSKR